MTVAPPRHRVPGRRLAVLSLLMVPALLVSFVAAELLGSAFQHALGLAENEMLTEAGAWGWVAVLFLMALLLVPQIAGIVLGVRARRLDEHRLGTVGVTVNAGIAAFLVLTYVLNLVFA